MDFIGYGLAALLFFVGLWIGKRTERKAIEREQQTHKDQTKEIVQKAKEELVQKIIPEVIKALESMGYSREQVWGPIVQDAIRASAASLAITLHEPVITACKQVMMKIGEEGAETPEAGTVIRHWPPKWWPWGKKRGSK